VDGAPRRSCVTPIGSLPANAQVRTIEALQELPEGQALQQAWLDLEVVQCGYCQPGQLMSAAALLAANRAPTDADIDAVMSGNICRCGTYGRIRAAIKQASGPLPRAAGAEERRAVEDHA
jgi:isoquinoline 1-oxidoreductase alpha subunit